MAFKILALIPQL